MIVPSDVRSTNLDAAVADDCRPTAPLWVAPGAPAWPDADRISVSGCLDVTVPARFHGPAEMGNGGWVAGVVAAMLPGQAARLAEVTLRAPTPLDVALHCEWSGYQARLYAPAGGILAEAVPLTAGQTPAAPPFVPLAVARHAAEGFAGHAEHPFPTCVVCGPRRAVGDGMRILPGPVAGEPGMVAAPWTVAASLAGADGRVPTAATWGALDCPTGWALYTPGAVALLGRLAVAVEADVVAGQTYVVVARKGGVSGRKAFAHAGLYDLSGALVAASRATWVSIG